MINFTKDRYYYADVYFNSKKGFIIQTRSGMLIDHLYSPCFLPFDANNEIIGEAVIKALSNSRMFDYDSDEYYDYMDLTKSKRWCPKKYAAYFLIITHNHYLHNKTPNQKP